MARIYLAGPLFNPYERREMEDLAQVLEEAGHTTFLPQRDGMNIAALAGEMQAAGASTEQTRAALLGAVFKLDMYQLLACSDLVLANLNGRVPDEGTIVEAAVAWHAGKALVLYKTDSRIVMQGGDNPILTGLTDFQVAGSMAALPRAVENALTGLASDTVARTVAQGAAIARARENTPDPADFARLLLGGIGNS